MRQVMDIAFAEGNRLHVPVILETDTQSKCDKYVHLGMQLAGKRSLGAYGALYDLSLIHISNGLGYFYRGTPAGFTT